MLDPSSRNRVPPASKRAPRCLRIFHLRLHHPHLALVDHRPDFGRRIHAIADAQLTGFLAAGLQKAGYKL